MHEKMKIRKAHQSDSSQIAPLLLMAMEDIIFSFIGLRSVEKAIQFLEEAVSKPANQYSYENCWVAEENHHITGAVCLYDGAELYALREPIKKMVEASFGREFNPEEETQSGEIYIDSVGVHPDYRGHGVGTALFRFVIDEFVHRQHKTLGLLVDIDNPKAKKLYQNLGFHKVGDKCLAGKTLEHLQLIPEKECVGN